MNMTKNTAKPYHHLEREVSFLGAMGHKTRSSCCTPFNDARVCVCVRTCGRISAYLRLAVANNLYLRLAAAELIKRAELSLLHPVITSRHCAHHKHRHNNGHALDPTRAVAFWRKENTQQQRHKRGRNQNQLQVEISKREKQPQT